MFMFMFMLADENRHVSMMNNEIAHGAKNSSTDFTESARANDDKIGLLFFCHVTYNFPRFS